MAYGQYSDLTPNLAGLMEGREHDIESKIVKPAAGINYGDAVFYDAADETGAYAPDSTDASLVFGGVAIISHRADAKAGVAEIYAQYDSVNVLHKGSVWVRVPSGESNTANKPAYLIHLTSDGDYGKFTATAGTNYVTGCYFKTNPLNGLALVEVRGIK